MIAEITESGLIFFVLQLEIFMVIILLQASPDDKRNKK